MGQRGGHRNRRDTIVTLAGDLGGYTPRQDDIGRCRFRLELTQRDRLPKQLARTTERQALGIAGLI